MSLVSVVLALAAPARGLVIGASARMRVPSIQACDAAPAAAPATGAAPEIVSFTDGALAQLEGMRTSSANGELMLRMGVRAGGCSGMSYVMDLAKPEDVTDGDTLVDIAPGMRCAVDPKSLMFLFGMQLDYSNELIGGGFSFNNPNAEEVRALSTRMRVDDRCLVHMHGRLLPSHAPAQLALHVDAHSPRASLGDAQTCGCGKSFGV